MNQSFINIWHQGNYINTQNCILDLNYYIDHTGVMYWCYGFIRNPYILHNMFSSGSLLWFGCNYRAHNHIGIIIWQASDWTAVFPHSDMALKYDGYWGLPVCSYSVYSVIRPTIQSMLQSAQTKFRHEICVQMRLNPVRYCQLVGKSWIISVLKQKTYLHGVLYPLTLLGYQVDYTDRLQRYKIDDHKPFIKQQQKWLERIENVLNSVQKLVTKL